MASASTRVSVAHLDEKVERQVQNTQYALKFVGAAFSSAYIGCFCTEWMVDQADFAPQIWRPPRLLIPQTCGWRHAATRFMPIADPVSAYSIKVRQQLRTQSTYCSNFR